MASKAKFNNGAILRTSEERNASVKVSNAYYDVGAIARYGAEIDGVTDDIQSFDNAILVQSQSTSGGTRGAKVVVEQGAAMVSVPIVVPNRVKIVASSARGTQIRATTDFVGNYVVDFIDGTSAMFETGMENIGVSANSVASLSCIRHNAFQENSDFINVHCDDFTVYGWEFVNGYGGAAHGKMTNCEAFGNAGATAGVLVNVAGFILNIDVLTSSGATSEQASYYGLQIAAGSIDARTLHMENAEHGLFLSGTNAQAHVGSITGHSSVTNTVRCSSTSNRLWATHIGLSASTSFSDGGNDDETVVLGDYYYPVRQTFGNDATPSVINRCPVYILGGTTTITAFDNVLNHQEWMAEFAATQTVDFSTPATLAGNGGVNFSAVAGDAMFCKHYNGTTYCTIVDAA